MPRSKPSKVITHRIELGSWERERIEGLLVAVEIQKIAEPAVALLSDASALVSILAILEVLGVIDLTNIDELGIFGSFLAVLTQIKDGAFDSIEEAMAAARASIPDGAMPPIGLLPFPAFIGLNWLIGKAKSLS